jgi:hypothetical protein
MTLITPTLQSIYEKTAIPYVSVACPCKATRPDTPVLIPPPPVPLPWQRRVRASPPLPDRRRCSRPQWPPAIAASNSRRHPSTPPHSIPFLLKLAAIPIRLKVVAYPPAIGGVRGADVPVSIAGCRKEELVPVLTTERRSSSPSSPSTGVIRGRDPLCLIFYCCIGSP